MFRSRIKQNINVDSTCKVNKISFKILDHEMLKTLLSKNNCTGLKKQPPNLQNQFGLTAVNCGARQSYQNITLRQLTYASPYISNQTLHNDLHVKTVEEESVNILQAYILLTSDKPQ